MGRKTGKEVPRKKAKSAEKSFNHQWTLIHTNRGRGDNGC